MKSEVTAMTKALVMTDKMPMPSRMPYQIPVTNTHGFNVTTHSKKTRKQLLQRKKKPL